MNLEEILQLIDHVSASSVTALKYETEEMKLSIRCGKKAVVTEVPALLSPTVEPKASGEQVLSSLVGTFYAAPSAEAEPYVKVGDSVKKGQVLAIVEAMKLMNEIESEFDGTVAEIYVKNGESVEYGTPLFRIV